MLTRIKKMRIILALVVFVLTATAGVMVWQMRSSEMVSANEKSAAEPAALSGPNREIRFGLQWEGLAFQTISQDDPSLLKGQSQVRQEGKEGVRLAVYKYVFEGGIQTERVLYFFYKAVKPVDRVVAVGTAEPEPVYNFNQSNTAADTAMSTTSSAETAAAQRAAEQNAYNEQQSANARAGLEAIRVRLP